MKRVILLDSDIPIFQICAVNQKTVQFGDGEPQVVNPPFEVLASQMDDYISTLKEQLNADRLIACLSEPDPELNWRRGVLPTYKMNRKSKTSPEYRQQLSDYVEENYECFKRPTLEGDDVMGILATDPDIVKGKKVIVSIDKDMATIPTRTFKDGVNYLFNPNKDKKPRKVTENQADWYWMFQALTGDTTDGYKGLPRCGPVAANKILGTFDDCEEGYIDLWWQLVVDAYEEKGFTMDDALVQAQVARICRTEDYDFKTKGVIPWNS